MPDPLGHLLKHRLALLPVALAGITAVRATEPSQTFVGAAACAGCHAEETTAWHGSQHGQTMQAATPAEVLNGASFVERWFCRVL